MNLQCPCCTRNLRFTHSDLYESSDEHISSSSVSIKNGYQCTNEYCIANNLQATWTEDGEIYVDPPEEIKWTVAHDIIKKSSMSGNYYAVGSWSDKYAKMTNAKDKKTTVFNMWKYRLKIIPIYRFDNKENDYRRTIFPKIEWWKRKIEYNEQLYVYVIPFYSRVNFLVREFNRKYRSLKRFIESGNDKKTLASFDMDVVIKCKRLMNSLGENDKLKISVTSVLTSLVIRVMYYNKCKVVKNFHNTHNSLFDPK